MSSDGERLAKLETDMQYVKGACERIERAIRGNNGSEPGLVTRTDRLEQKLALIARWFWLFAMATAGLVVKAILGALGITI